MSVKNNLDVSDDDERDDPDPTAAPALFFIRHVKMKNAPFDGTNHLFISQLARIYLFQFEYNTKQTIFTIISE